MYGEVTVSLRERLATAHRILYAQETTDNVGRGHQSVILADRRRMLITAHIHEEARGIESAGPDDLVIADLDGQLIEGRLPPMQEYPIHTWVYRLRQDVNSVVHVHPFYAGVLAMADVPILPVSKDGCLFLDGVPIFNQFPPVYRRR